MENSKDANDIDSDWPDDIDSAIGVSVAIRHKFRLRYFCWFANSLFLSLHQMFKSWDETVVLHFPGERSETGFLAGSFNQSSWSVLLGDLERRILKNLRESEVESLRREVGRLDEKMRRKKSFSKRNCHITKQITIGVRWKFDWKSIVGKIEGDTATWTT